MPTVVVPFRGTEGKSRLAGLPLDARAAVREAMLADVLVACQAVGATYLVTSAQGLRTTAALVVDDGRGQGAAVAAGLEFAGRMEAPAPFLVVNADLPCVTARDLLALAGAIPDHGLALVAAADNTTIVGNVADDIEIPGLHVSPDLDSVLYGLAGLADDERGWGRAAETWNALETVAELGGESWFRLGDRDLGLHLVRTELLHEGMTLSGVTARLAESLGLRCRLLPATDDPLRTFVETPAGTFPFQTWFVARGHSDEVDAVHYAGALEARAAPHVVESIDAADVIVITPSNPYVSIGPILAVEEVRAALERRRVPCVAVSPLIGGRAVKGPADRMLERIAGGTSPGHVASCYAGLIDALVIDAADSPAELPPGVRAVVTKTLMRDDDARRRLAQDVPDAAGAVA